MTHKDIYTKFMIEYDKAGASTSYPSLTEYEVATVLDKAYNALIAQKVTGNNYRRVAVEGDLKSIADLGPLTKSDWVKVDKSLDNASNIAPNVTACKMPTDLLYVLGGSMKYINPEEINNHGPYVTEGQSYNPVDGKAERGVEIKLVNHEIAQKFFSTGSNIPWVKNPVCFIEDRNIYIVYDPLNPPVVNDEGTDKSFRITYIYRPKTFVKDLPDPETGYNTYFDYSPELANETFERVDGKEITYAQRYSFECNSTVAEELISLAVAFALENVESQRLNSKLNMRGLEA